MVIFMTFNIMNFEKSQTKTIYRFLISQIYYGETMVLIISFVYSEFYVDGLILF